MDRLFVLIAGIVTLGLCFVIAPVFVNSYRRYRDRKTTICPDTSQIAEVEVKTFRAVFGSQQRSRVKLTLQPFRRHAGLRTHRLGPELAHR